MDIDRILIREITTSLDTSIRPYLNKRIIYFIQQIFIFNIISFFVNALNSAVLIHIDCIEYYRVKCSTIHWITTCQFMASFLHSHLPLPRNTVINIYKYINGISTYVSVISAGNGIGMSSSNSERIVHFAIMHLCLIMGLIAG